MNIHLLGELASARLARVGSRVSFHLSFGFGDEATAIEFDMEGHHATRLLKALQDVGPSDAEASAAFQLNEDGALFGGREHRG